MRSNIIALIPTNSPIAYKIATVLAKAYVEYLDHKFSDLESEAQEHFVDWCAAYRAIGARIELEKTVITVTINGETASVDANSL